MTPTRKTQWTCRDGFVTCAAAMSTQHLKNAIHWIRRQPDEMVWGDFWDGPAFADVEEWEKDGHDKEEWIACFTRELHWRHETAPAKLPTVSEEIDDYPGADYNFNEDCFG